MNEFHGYLVFDNGVILSKETRRTNYERRTMSVLIDDKGYHKVQLVIDDKQRQLRVHRIVAAVFLSFDLNDTTIEIHHKNGDKSDNRVCNLQIVSKSLHNHLHSIKDGDSATHKVCRNCNVLKLRSEFYELSSCTKYDAHSSWCKHCANHRSPEYLAKRREKNRK